MTRMKLNLDEVARQQLLRQIPGLEKTEIDGKAKNAA
jgi:hypothetical protein